MEGRLLVLPHEAAVAEDIGTEYGGELTFQCSPPARDYYFRPAVALRMASAIGFPSAGFL